MPAGDEDRDIIVNLSGHGVDDSRHDTGFRLSDRTRQPRR